jgi:hypothetical protein
MLVALNTTFVELTVSQDGMVLPDLVVSAGDLPALEVFLNPVGPKGDRGEQGEVSASSIGQLSDVVLTNVKDGDLLVYQSAKFINTSKENLTDGGNF